MTCHEARDLYSALLDEALDAGKRAAVQAHVAGCAECARELERFGRTVSIIRAAAPVRAPVGFVDRVLASARPAPWYRRLTRRLFWPLRVKLPLEAAAVVLVAGAAMYVFQHTPELQQAARQETPRPETAAPSPPPPAPVSSYAAPGATKATPEAAKRAAVPEASRPAPPPVGATPAQKPAAPSETGKSDAKSPDVATTAGKSPELEGAERRAKEADGRAQSKSAADGARAERAAEPTAPEAHGRAAREHMAPDPAARDRVLPSVLSDAPPGAQPSSPAREDKGAAPTAAAPPAATASPGLLRKSAPAPAEVSPTGPRANSGTGQGADQAARPADGRLQAAPRARQDTASPAGADVAAWLAAADPEAAVRGLAELLDRAGGREVSRRPDGDAAAIDVLVPRERYADFLHGLSQLGRLRLGPEPATLPALVRLSLRIGG